MVLAEVKSIVDDLFPYAEASFKQLLTQKSQVVSVKRGDILLYPGDMCGICPIVVSGGLKVYLSLENGREILLYTIDKGEACMFVTVSLLKNMPYPAFAEADKDSLLLVVDDKTFRELFDRYTYWREFFLNMIAKNIYQTFLMLNEVISKRVDKRLLRYLYEIGKDKRLVEETHEEIARKIGTAREVVTRILKRLEVEGLVEISRGQIRIKNFDALKKEIYL